MTKIGLLSDTHGYWDERYLKYFEPCDEIWHAGDIGSMEIIERLEAFRLLRAVYGNIDGHDIRLIYPEINRFTIDGADVLMKHIGGYPTSIREPLGNTASTKRVHWCGFASTKEVFLTWK